MDKITQPQHSGDAKDSGDEQNILENIDNSTSNLQVTRLLRKEIYDDLRQQGMSAEEAEIALNNYVESNLGIVNEYEYDKSVMFIAAVGCFAACWVVTLMISANGGGDNAAKVAGIVLGGIFYLITNYAEKPEIQDGAKYGNMVYLLTLLGYCSINMT